MQKMKNMDKVANFFAKNSVARFQKSRIIRVVSRSVYRGMSNIYCVVSPEHIRRQSLHEMSVPVDTYPWPYRESWFADWEEDDSKNNYSLVSDSSGFIVKRSTSYCAWKINEEFGIWLDRPKWLASCDAKHWHRLLHDNGYRSTVKRPEPGKHYVGIAPSKGIHGECVWFEGFDDGNSVERTNDTGGEIIYSTYRDKKFEIGAAPAEWYIWVEIST